MPDSAIKMTRLQMAAVESHAVEHLRLFTHRLAHIPFIHSSVRENTETTPRRRSSTHVDTSVLLCHDATTSD